MSDRYAYLGCCTQEERENEGTQDEYLELEVLREKENPENLYRKLTPQQQQALKIGDVVHWINTNIDSDAADFDEWFIEAISHKDGTCVVRWNNPHSKNGVDEYFNEDALISDLYFLQAIKTIDEPEKIKRVLSMNEKFTSIPLYTHLDLAGAQPSDIGRAWRNLALAENQIAEKLKELPEGTAAVLNSDYVWFLAEATRPDTNETRRELIRANIDQTGMVSNLVSRYDLADLSWVDIEESDLLAGCQGTLIAAAQFKTRQFNTGSEEYIDWVAEKKCKGPTNEKSPKEFEFGVTNSHDQSYAEAEEIAGAKESWSLVDRKEAKKYGGTVLGVTRHHVVQSLGKTAAIHHKANLYRVPAKDEMVNIVYDGKRQGKVEPRVKAQDKSQSR